MNSATLLPILLSRFFTLRSHLLLKSDFTNLTQNIEIFCYFLRVYFCVQLYLFYYRAMSNKSLNFVVSPKKKIIFILLVFLYEFLLSGITLRKLLKKRPYTLIHMRALNSLTFGMTLSVKLMWAIRIHTYNNKMEFFFRLDGYFIHLFASLSCTLILNGSPFQSTEIKLSLV